MPETSEPNQNPRRPLAAPALGALNAAPPAVFVLDVDGVMTDGRAHYTAEGKLAKVFGPDDHDALCLLKPFLEICFVSGDRRGFDISRARIERDMGFPLSLVSTVDRLAWIAERWDPASVIYMGDGIFDGRVFEGVGFGICPNDGDADARAVADLVTERRGGDRCVAEASKHLLDRWFGGASTVIRGAGRQGQHGVASGWGEGDLRDTA